MAMMALSKSDCDEILSYFRATLPGVDDSLLQELAANHELDALVDLDAADIQQLLETPGPKIVLRGSLQNAHLETISWHQLFTDPAMIEIDSSTVASALLVIKTAARHSLKVFSGLVSFLEKELHPAATFGSSLYYDKNLGDKASELVLVLSGVGTDRETLDGRWRGILTRREQADDTDMEIPAFLRRHETLKHKISTCYFDVP